LVLRQASIRVGKQLPLFVLLFARPLDCEVVSLAIIIRSLRGNKARALKLTSDVAISGVNARDAKHKALIVGPGSAASLLRLLYRPSDRGAKRARLINA